MIQLATVPLITMPLAATRLATVPLADSDAGKGSPIGLLVVLLLIVAVYFLYRSMNRHLRKVPGRFDQQGPPTPAQSGRPPAGPAAEPPTQSGTPAQPGTPMQSSTQPEPPPTEQ